MGQIEAMVLSMVVEAPVAFALVRVCDWPCRGPTHAALAIALATAATHPQLWAASLWLYPRLGYGAAVVLAEAGVVLVEAGIVAWVTELSPARSILVSALANAASVAVGLLLFG